MPILIHAGRGMPPIADGLADLALRHPEVVLILAHGAICDQGILTSRLADHPGVLYDTSCFFPMDVIELFARVPAERIVFASDPPYGLTASGLYLALRVAAHAGLDEQAIGGVIGETMAGLVDGRGLPPVSPPRGERADRDAGRLARAYGYASLAGPALFAGAVEQAQGHARPGDRGVPRPRARGRVGEALEQIGAALIAARALLDERGRPAPGDRPAVQGGGARGDRAAQLARQPQRRPLPLLATGSLAQAKALSERVGHLVGLLAQQPTCDQIEARWRDGESGWATLGQVEQQRSQQVGEHHVHRFGPARERFGARRWALRGTPCRLPDPHTSHGSALAAQVKAAGLDLDAR